MRAENGALGDFFSPLSLAKAHVTDDSIFSSHLPRVVEALKVPAGGSTYPGFKVLVVF